MPPPVTKRRQFVERLKLRLAAISTATTLPDGFTYQTNLGARPIARWPTHLQFSAEHGEGLPALGIFDQDNIKQQDFPRQKGVPNMLHVQVRIFLGRAPDVDEVDAMLGDVMRAIVTDVATGLYEPTFGGLATDTKPESDGFISPNETLDLDAAAISFTIEFLSGPFNAYQ